jgi:hypothetical protein
MSRSAKEGASCDRSTSGVVRRRALIISMPRSGCVSLQLEPERVRSCMILFGTCTGSRSTRVRPSELSPPSAIFSVPCSAQAGGPRYPPHPTTIDPMRAASPVVQGGVKASGSGQPRTALSGPGATVSKRSDAASDNQAAVPTSKHENGTYRRDGGTSGPGDPSARLEEAERRSQKEKPARATPNPRPSGQGGSTTDRSNPTRRPCVPCLRVLETCAEPRKSRLAEACANSLRANE